MDTKVLEEMGFDLSQEDGIDGVMDYALLEQRVAASIASGHTTIDRGSAELADATMRGATKQERDRIKQYTHLERYGSSVRISGTNTGRLQSATPNESNLPRSK